MKEFNRFDYKDSIWVEREIACQLAGLDKAGFKTAQSNGFFREAYTTPSLIEVESINMYLRGEVVYEQLSERAQHARKVALAEQEEKQKAQDAMNAYNQKVVNAFIAKQRLNELTKGR